MTAFVAALLALCVGAPPTAGPQEVAGLKQAVARAEKARCGALSLRLTAYDDGAATRVQLWRGEVVVSRFPVEGPPELWRRPVEAAACKRLARQLASRLPDPPRWPRLVKRLDARRGGPGDTALRVAIGRHVLKVRVAEVDVQEVGFVAMARAELFRLAALASEGRVTY